MTAPPRLVATAEAMTLLRRLRGSNGGLMMHQSGGCCDGSSPMCYPAGEFIVGDRDVLLGVLDLRLGVGEIRRDQPRDDKAVPVWISGSQFEVWKHTQLVLDVVPGRGSGFSLETPHGLRFLSRARAFTGPENVALTKTPPLVGVDYQQGRRPLPAWEPQVVAEAAEACPVPAPHLATGPD